MRRIFQVVTTLIVLISCSDRPRADVAPASKECRRDRLYGERGQCYIFYRHRRNRPLDHQGSWLPGGILWNARNTEINDAVTWSATKSAAG